MQKQLPSGELRFQFPHWSFAPQWRIQKFGIGGGRVGVESGDGAVPSPESRENL